MTVEGEVAVRGRQGERRGHVASTKHYNKQISCSTLIHDTLIHG